MLPHGATPSRDDRSSPAPLPAKGAGQRHDAHDIKPLPYGDSAFRPQPLDLLDPDIRRLLAAGRQAEAHFNDQRKRRRTQLACWLGLGLFALLPGGLLAAMPDRVVATLPATAALYQTVGRTVNVYGVEIRSVDVQNLLLDGQRVMSVKGEIVNVSQFSRKIPWLRFGLRRADGREVYHWQLDTDARPLRPGETRTFTTRLAAPPETATRIEIRFAHADEIGSNTAP